MSIAKRLFKNWKTTTLGVSLIIACLVLVYFEKATLTEMSAFLAGGFYFLFKNDANV